MSIEAMKQALEYIEATNKSSSFWMVPASELNKTVNALRQAIEQAEKQEPVATVVSENEPVTMSWWHEPALPVGTKLYTTPQPQHEFVGLTDEDRLHLVDTHVGFVSPSHPLSNDDWINYASAIEAKLKEKNTP